MTTYHIRRYVLSGPAGYAPVGRTRCGKVVTDETRLCRWDGTIASFVDADSYSGIDSARVCRTCDPGLREPTARQREAFERSRLAPRCARCDERPPVEALDDKFCSRACAVAWALDRLAFYRWCPTCQEHVKDGCEEHETETELAEATS